MKFINLSHNIYEMESFLTQEECRHLINLSEQEGYCDADVQVYNTREMIKSIRNNERVNYYSEEWAKAWWERLNKATLPTFEGKKAVGLSPYFRFYKYSQGQKFNLHKDGRQQVNGQETLFTFLVYLNEGYEGGNTQFRQDALEITSKAGNALFFEHHLWHQSTLLNAGNKYVVRTDVIYQ